MSQASTESLCRSLSAAVLIELCHSPQWSRALRGILVLAAVSAVSAGILPGTVAAGDPPTDGQLPGGPPTGESSPAGCLPGDAQGVYFLDAASSRTPPEYQHFAQETGVTWTVVWDPLCSSPRFLFPHDPFLLPRQEPPAQEYSILADFLAFLETNRDFFGIGPDGLDKPELLPFDDGWLIAAHQVHDGLPVRGSHINARVNGDRTIRSITPRIARSLPPVPRGDLNQEDVCRLAANDGIVKIIAITPQVAFPAGLESAQAAWGVAGRDSDGRDVEVLYGPAGERLLLEPMTLYFGEDCTGTIRFDGQLFGQSPPPSDVYAMPFQFGPKDVYPLAGLQVHFTIPVSSGLVEIFCSADRDGAFSFSFAPACTEQSWWLSLTFGDGHFRFIEGLWPYIGFSLPFAGEKGGWTNTFNQQSAEFDAFHISAFHHLTRAATDVASLVRRHRVPYFAGDLGKKEAEVRLRKTSYEHSYEPFTREFIFASDQVTPRAPDGRWRKIVPTVLYHEYGHEVFRGLTDGAREREANEGISDAFSAYVAGVSTIGYVDPVTPGIDPASRDLKDDTTSWPDDARRTLAGALWELWDSTRDPPDPKDPDRKPQSSFAFGLLTRWLAGKNHGDAMFLGGRTVEFTWYLGTELYVEADHPSLGGDGTFRNGIPHQEEFLHAFGSRNLFQYPFVRGDANTDGKVDISDALAALGYLFLGRKETTCADAMDTNDSGSIDISDPIFLLQHLFMGGVHPPAPYPRCGPDDTPRDGLTCWASACRLISPN